MSAFTWQCLGLLSGGALSDSARLPSLNYFHSANAGKGSPLAVSPLFVDTDCPLLQCEVTVALETA